MVVNVVNGQHQQGLNGRLLKFGVAVVQVLECAVANKVGQVDQKRLPNVFGVKTVHTVDVKCLTAVVLTVLHYQCVVQQVADMVQLTVHQICTSLCQVHHLQELQECHVQVVTKQMDKDKETTEYSQEGVVLLE